MSFADNVNVHTTAAVVDDDDDNYAELIRRHSSRFTPRMIRTTWSIFNLFLLAINLKMIVFRHSLDQKVHGTNNNNNNDTMTVLVKNVPGNTTGFIPYDKIFGHVHMAKTAGTEINGELAAHYERVCGHKGYSYDAVQMNKRDEEWAKAHRGQVTVKNGGPDIISEKYEQYSRGRVPPLVMKEIGFEDCDYISMETSWMIWKSVAKVWPLELHVPCRDPLEHLMSQCNHRYHKFNCGAKNLRDEVKRCLLDPERFDAQLARLDKVSLKCFSAVPMEPYLEYMDQFLQRKRVETPYVHRDSNKPRHKDQECIWKNQTTADRVLEILYTYDYYHWCRDCMGSEHDLLRLPLKL